MIDTQNISANKRREPSVVALWRLKEELIEKLAYLGHFQKPKCCFNCMQYQRDSGFCVWFQTQVPEDFSVSFDSCEDWVDEVHVPF